MLKVDATETEAYLAPCLNRRTDKRYGCNSLLTSLYMQIKSFAGSCLPSQQKSTFATAAEHVNKPCYFLVSMQKEFSVFSERPLVQ